MSLFGDIGQGIQAVGRGLFAQTLPGQYLSAIDEAKRRQREMDAFRASLPSSQASPAPMVGGFGITPPAPIGGSADQSMPPQDEAMPLAGGPQGGQMDPTTIAAMAAARRGQWGAAGNLVKRPDPRIQIGPDGRPYDASQPLSAQPDRFGNPANVNGTIVDLNSPSNANRTIPTLNPGEDFVYGPDGKSAPPVGVRNMDGAIKALTDRTAATAGATESAKAERDIVQIPMADGSTRSMTRAQAAAYFSGQGGPAGGASPPRIGQPAPAAGPPLGASQTPGNAAYDKNVADAAAKQYADLQTAGQSAPQTIATMQQIGSLLGDFQGGKLGKMGFDLATAANGIPGFRIDAKTSNAQAAEAIVNQVALQLRSTANGAGMPGSMSNADRDFLVKSVPGLMQSPEGRSQLIQYYTAVQQRSMDVAGFARKWQQRYGRIDAPDQTGKSFQDYLNGWSASNPLFGGGGARPSGPPSGMTLVPGVGYVPRVGAN